MNIFIPKPCHENWNTMSPREQGRHCEVCSKTVIDFSGMQNEEIVSYLTNRSSGGVCGRFKESQLAVPQRPVFNELVYNIIDSRLFSYARKWMAIVLVCFIFSQNTNAQTKPPAKKADTVCVDKKPMLLGEIAIQPDNKVKPKSKPGKNQKRKVTTDNKKQTAREPNKEVMITMGMVKIN